MKTRILAAVLRFSDELDCSNRRIRGILNAAPPAEGIKYWERLKLISDVEFKMPYIRLIIDNNYIRHSPNQEECFEWLQEVYTKIEQERALVVQCFKEEGSALHIAEVQLDFGRNGLRKEYDGFLEKKKSSPPSEENLEEQQSPTHLDVEGLKSRIRDRVEEKNLFCEVHHYISGKEKGMRNHLDCNGLLTDPDIVVGIVNAFINNIYTQTFENGISEIANSDYLLVGVANSGVLLASRIAMITGLPMVYYVPPRKDEQFTVREKEWKNYLDDIEKRKAILILGVNVTGDSIQNAKEFLHTVSPEGRPIQIEAVLGIVNRDKSNAYLNELRNNGTRVDFLLNEYPIDWCNYTDGDCPYHRQCLEREKK